MAKHPAAFLHHDSVICIEGGSIANPHAVILPVNGIRALKLLQNHFLLFILADCYDSSTRPLATGDMSAIKKSFTDSAFDENVIIYDVFLSNLPEDGFYNDNNEKAVFMTDASTKYNLDLKNSFIIGTHPMHLIPGINSGVTPLYLQPGRGLRSLNQVPFGIKLCENILSAAAFMIRLKQKRIKGLRRELVESIKPDKKNITV